MKSPQSEFELLCERCGYSIEGLGPSTECPECGAPTESSLPNTRPGSPWQQDPGAGTWVRTLVRSVGKPWRIVGEIEMEPVRAGQLRRVNALIASGLATVAPTLCYLIQIVRHEAPIPLREVLGRISIGVFDLVFCLLLAFVGWGLLRWVILALTHIEARGIRVFGATRGFRITPTVATAITSHASAGWVVGGVLIASGFALGLGLFEIAMHREVGWMRGPMMLSPILLPAIGATVGLLVFETLTYLGVRRCRFANRMPEESRTPGV